MKVLKLYQEILFLKHYFFIKNKIMEKEKAKRKLEKMILSLVKQDSWGKLTINLPVKDLSMKDIKSPEPKIAKTFMEQEKINDPPIVFENFSFRELLCKVYDLQEINP